MKLVYVTLTMALVCFVVCESRAEITDNFDGLNGTTILDKATTTGGATWSFSYPSGGEIDAGDDIQLDGYGAAVAVGDAGPKVNIVASVPFSYTQGDIITVSAELLIDGITETNWMAIGFCDDTDLSLSADGGGEVRVFTRENGEFSIRTNGNSQQTPGGDAWDVDLELHEHTLIFDSSVGSVTYKVDGVAKEILTLSLAQVQDIQISKAFFAFSETVDVDAGGIGRIDSFTVSSESTSQKIPGDANNDGKVDGSDVTILAGNWQVGVDGTETASWDMGDFNGDGKVDGSDVTILAGNWQYGVEASSAAVPEPSSFLLLLGIVLTGCLTSLRRKR